MSYCRFSSDDWKSDVYVYESDAGWVTHVAARRHVLSELPPRVDLPNGFTDEQFSAWCARQAAVSAAVEAAELVDIGGPYDGADFTDDTPGGCADRLLMLREAGYYVPEYALAALREEATEAGVSS